MIAKVCRGGLAAVTFVCSLGTAFAADPLVQDFDGWKITIQPGESAFIGDVPPSPQSATPRSAFPIIRTASFQETLGEPRPEGATPPASATLVPAVQIPTPIAPATVPVIDGLPIITPGESSQCCDSKPIVSPPEGTVDPRYLSQMYYEIYKSIPFIRAEYNANPSYIHDTTVEFLFGKMRPTVIHRGTTTVNHYGTYGGYGSPYGYLSPYAYDGRTGFVYPTVPILPAGNRGWGPSYGRNN